MLSWYCASVTFIFALNELVVAQAAKSGCDKFSMGRWRKNIFFSLFQHGSLAEYSKNKYQFYPCKTWKREATVGFLKWQKAVHSLPMHPIFLINVLIRSWPKGTSEKKKTNMVYPIFARLYCKLVFIVTLLSLGNLVWQTTDSFLEQTIFAAVFKLSLSRTDVKESRQTKFLRYVRNVNSILL